MEVDENIVVAQRWNLGFLLEFQAVKAVLTDNSPLLGRSRCHCCYPVPGLKVDGFGCLEGESS